MSLITYREALKSALSEEIERDENRLVRGHRIPVGNGHLPLSRVQGRTDQAARRTEGILAT